jgi:hypothetical protein
MPITRQQHRRQLQNHTGVNGVIATTSALVNMDQLPGPGTFSGRPDENGKNWLDRFELWASCKGYNDDIKKAALALYLQESAATWLQVLPDVEKDTFAHLRTSFQKRYGPSQQAGWQRASQLWTLQQEAGESALDFIAKIQRAARDINMTEELQCFAVINGLRPAIRAHVLRQNPGDIAALRQAAVLAEQTEPPVSTTDDRLARIEHQLQLLTVNVFNVIASTNLQVLTAILHLLTAVDRRRRGHHYGSQRPDVNCRRCHRIATIMPRTERRRVASTPRQPLPNDVSSSTTNTLVNSRAKIVNNNCRRDDHRRLVPAAVVATTIVRTATSGKPSALTATRWAISHGPAVLLAARTADRSALRAHRKQTGGLLAGVSDVDGEQQQQHQQTTIAPISLRQRVQILFA